MTQKPGTSKDAADKLVKNTRRKTRKPLLQLVLSQARIEIKAWKYDYNKNRPHSSLGNVTPNEFAMKMTL